MELNFFNITCFAYALLALLTRVIMVFYREKWNKWELNKAYTKSKPLWIYIVAVFSLIFILLCWYMAFTSDISSGWILATLLSITLIKISQLIFNYEKFRTFASKALYDKNKMRKINLGVVVFAFILISLGLLLYS